MKSKKLKYKKITDFDTVTEFLRNNFSSPTHWPDWNLLISKYYNTLFYYFGLYENTQLIGICPVHETKSGLLKNLNSGQFHYIPNGGWLTSKQVKIAPFHIPIPFNSYFECFGLPLIEEFGAVYAKITKPFSTLLVDLNKTEEQIWMESMNYRRRRMIKKAQKHDISIQNTLSNLDLFYTLYKNANKVYGLKNMEHDFFKELLETQHINFVPFVAFRNDNPCGALGLIYDYNYAIYWLGATDFSSENLGQGELLQWEAIRYSKTKGCKYYDLCYIEKERLPKIYEFKKGFSNREVVVPYIMVKPLTTRIYNKVSKFLKK